MSFRTPSNWIQDHQPISSDNRQISAPALHVPQLKIPIKIGQSSGYKIADSHLAEIFSNLWVGKNQSGPKQYEGCSAEHVQRVLVTTFSIVVRVKQFHGHGSLLSLHLLIVQPTSSPFRIVFTNDSTTLTASSTTASTVVLSPI